MTDQHDRYRDWGAAYVLGALEPAERAAFERHLDACTRCQADVRSFAPLPGLLSTVSAEDVEALASRDADEAATARVTRVASDRARAEGAALRRSLRRWRMAAAGTAAAAAIALAAVVLPGSPDVATQDLAISAAEATTGRLAVSERGWGTHVEVELEGLPARDAYLLRAIATDGTVQTAATWGPTPSGRARLVGATAIQLEDLERLEVTSEDATEVLVSASPDR